MRSIPALFPRELQPVFACLSEKEKELREIRIRTGQPVVAEIGNEEFYIDQTYQLTRRFFHPVTLGRSQVEEVLLHLCRNSPYAFEDELRRGFLAVPGGHRVGVCGHVVWDEKGHIQTLNNISSLNIRIAHELKGVASKVLPYVYDGERLRNILILSPPGCGKTTLLRDLIRQISDGNKFAKGLNVSVVDERSELAGTYMGNAQNDLGIRTDIMDSCTKAQGILMMLRSMAPEVIAVDEIGSQKDLEAVREALVCGCRVLATVHGEDSQDGKKRFPELFDKGVFSCVIILGKRAGTPILREIQIEGVKKFEDHRDSVNPDGKLGARFLLPGKDFGAQSGNSLPDSVFGDVDERDPIRKDGSFGVLPKYREARVGRNPKFAETGGRIL